MSVFQNNSFYPQNFFIPYEENASIREITEQITSEAVTLEPGFFDGKTPVFDFKFLYHPPYVSSSDFPEMKKLQRAALGSTRFKSEYNGYISIDITEWVDHCDEDHFRNCFAFLADMSDNWKYIFYTSKPLPEKTLNKVLNAVQSYIWTVRPDNTVFVSHEITDILQAELKDKSGKSFSESCLNMMKYIFFGRKSNDRSFIDRFINDIIGFFGRLQTINSSDMQKYLDNPSTFGAYAMTSEEKRWFSNIKEIGR